MVVTENLNSISDRLQNPESESDRMVAWDELQNYIKEHPSDIDAHNLQLKYQTLNRDFGTELATPDYTRDAE